MNFEKTTRFWFQMRPVLQDRLAQAKKDLDQVWKLRNSYESLEEKQNIWTLIRQRQEQCKSFTQDLEDLKIFLSEKDGGEEPELQIATLLHERLCHYNHTDYCSWNYDIMHGEYWYGFAHDRYLTKAFELIKNSGKSAEDVLSVLKHGKEVEKQINTMILNGEGAVFIG